VAGDVGTWKTRWRGGQCGGGGARIGKVCVGRRHVVCVAHWCILGIEWWRQVGGSRGGCLWIVWYVVGIVGSWRRVVVRCGVVVWCELTLVIIPTQQSRRVGALE